MSITESAVVANPRHLTLEAATVPGVILLSMPCRHGHGGEHTFALDREEFARLVRQEFDFVPAEEVAIARMTASFDADAELANLLQEGAS